MRLGLGSAPGVSGQSLGPHTKIWSRVMAKVRSESEKLVGLMFLSGIVALVIFVLVGGILSEAATRDQDAKTTDASPKNKPGSITGRITIQGKPASNLIVTLQPRHNHIVDKAIATASTDEEGRYHFSDILPGHYWIKIFGREYVTAGGVQYYGPGRDVSLSDGGLVLDTHLMIRVRLRQLQSKTAIALLSPSVRQV